MLNGIGGRTIEEAKANLSYREVNQWRAYINQTGTLNLGVRLEEGIALLAMVFNRGFGGKAEFSDFLPARARPQQAEELPVATDMDIFKLLQGVRA